MVSGYLFLKLISRPGQHDAMTRNVWSAVDSQSQQNELSLVGCKAVAKVVANVF
jgi:hypothetical protein